VLSPNIYLKKATQRVHTNTYSFTSYNLEIIFLQADTSIDTKVKDIDTNFTIINIAT